MKRTIRRRLTAFLLILLLLSGACLLYGKRIAPDVEARRLQSVREAVAAAAAQCYAVEGAYPEKLSYLEEHYGLIINHERYFISYDCYAANERPEIMVLKK